MAMMGVAFSLIPAVMWPSVAYIVEQSKLGTAYGLMTMIQNIGLAGFNLLVGCANRRSTLRGTYPLRLTIRLSFFSLRSRQELGANTEYHPHQVSSTNRPPLRWT